MNIFRSTIALLVVLAASAGARPPWVGGGPPGGTMGGGTPPTFVRQLFPPPLVMQNQEKLKLDDAQRSAIRLAMQETHTALVDLQWKLDAESEKLEALLAVDRPDEAAVLTQVDQVLAVEQQVKKTHLRLLVRIKAQLTKEQQAMLRELRRTEKLDGGPPPQ